MLSDNDKNNIAVNASNYEEYFLLYVDNELTPEQRTAVEAFAAAHPHLQEELSSLLNTQLPAEDICINKDDLMAGSMKLCSEEEQLLLYIDDELPPDEKDLFRKKIESSDHLQIQHSLLLKTKLDKNEIVHYPAKEKLYHYSKAFRPVYWLRMAAAIILILSIGLLVWMGNTKEQLPVVVQAPQKKAEPQKTQPLAEPEPQKQPVQNLALEHKATTDRKTQPIRISKKENKQVIIVHATEKAAIEIAQNNIRKKVNKEAQLVVNTPVTLDPHHQEKVEPTQQIINTDAVTSAIKATYTTTEAADNNFINAVATTNNKKGRSIRGVLRKATRFIERTTNVNPVNDNNELLIGAVAIKLK